MIKKVQLQELLDFTNGKTIPNTKGEFPAYGSNGIISYTGDFNFDNVIIIGRVGANCGSIHIEENKCWVSDNAIAAEHKDKECKFYNYYLMESLGLNKKKIGSSQPLLTQSILNKIKVPIIENKNSKIQIGKFLNYLDKKIKLNNKINTELENTAKNLYDYWFVQFDFPNENNKPYKSFGGEVVYNEELKRKIPTSFSPLLLKDRLSFERGLEYGSSAYIEGKQNQNCVKFYRVGDMDDTGNTYINSAKYDCPLANEDDLLVSFDGSVGRIAYAVNGTFSTGIRKIFDNECSLNQATLYFIFSDKHIQHTINQYAAGTNILHAAAAIDHLFIPFNSEIYLKFQKIVTPIFEKMKQLKMENQELAKIKHFLMPMLINSKVTIKEN